MVNYSFDENGNQLPPKNKTVTEINEYIKWLIDGERQLQDIYVVGELSNFKKHTTGHCYFSLKDEKSEIRAVMFASYARKLNFKYISTFINKKDVKEIEFEENLKVEDILKKEDRRLAGKTAPSPGPTQ